MPKSIRTLIKSSPRWRPFPWSRFSADDCPRTKALPKCPSAKCRRAKACLAAHKGLFCQRTHFSRSEGQQRMPKSEMERHIAGISLPPAQAVPDLHMVYLKEIAGLRRAEQQEKMKLWRAGAYGDEYGPYTTKGVMKVPPPRLYLEE